jgi:large subunit ribosomal protein L3
MMSLLGEKRSMTQLYDEQGLAIPVTEIHVGDCVVTAKRVKDKHGYDALQIGYGAASKRKSTKPALGPYKKSGLAAPRVLREIRIDSADSYKVGDKLGPAVFAVGDTVHVTGITRGRGFSGGMRRWGWHGGPATHGSMSHRRIGSLGSGTSPGRALRGRTLPGHYGVEQATVKNLSVVKVEPEKGLLYVSGGVPGHRGSIVLVRRD